MGQVRLGYESYLDRQVAVKLLALQGIEVAPAEFQHRFQREARVLANLQHPHIVGCHQAGVTAQGRCYIVMEFIDGPDLKQYIHDNGLYRTLPAYVSRVK